MERYFPITFGPTVVGMKQCTPVVLPHDITHWFDTSMQEGLLLQRSHDDKLATAAAFAMMKVPALVTMSCAFAGRSLFLCRSMSMDRVCDVKRRAITGSKSPLPSFSHHDRCH
jgi:hypothetical protein